MIQREHIFQSWTDRFLDRIVLDGVTYMNGRTYDVPIEVAAVMYEQQARGWQHQAQTEGKDNSRFYLEQQTKNTAIRLSPVKGQARVNVN